MTHYEGSQQVTTGATLGFYFRGMTKEQANEIRARLNEIAAELGYTAKGGQTVGEGNAAALMVAIANGDVRLVKRQSA